MWPSMPKSPACHPDFMAPCRFKWYGTVFRSYLFGYEFFVVGDKSLLRGALSNEEDVGFTLPVLTANEIIDP